MSSDRSSKRPSLRDRMGARALAVRDAHMERVEALRQARVERHDAHRHGQGRARRGDALSREQIAAAAAAIADAQGIDALSMRKIAAVLGAGTMSLYHHVRTKDDLLAIMDDLVMGEVLVPERDLALGWPDAIAAIARQTHRTLRRHPWALTGRRNSRGGVNSLRHVEQSLAALAATPLSVTDKLGVLVIVDDYVYGRAMRALEFTATRSAEWKQRVGEGAAFLAQQSAGGDYPNLSALIGGDTAGFAERMVARMDPEPWFETGLQALLAGLGLRFGLRVAGDDAKRK